MRKVIRKRIRYDKDGVQVAGDINAVVSANVGEPGSTHTHTESHQVVVQKSGRKKKPKPKKKGGERRGER